MSIDWEKAIEECSSNIGGTCTILPNDMLCDDCVRDKKCPKCEKSGIINKYIRPIENKINKLIYDWYIFSSTEIYGLFPFLNFKSLENHYINKYGVTHEGPIFIGIHRGILYFYKLFSETRNVFLKIFCCFMLFMMCVISFALLMLRNLTWPIVCMINMPYLYGFIGGIVTMIVLTIYLPLRLLHFGVYSLCKLLRNIFT